MKLFANLFQKDRGELICGRCEKPLLNHDDAACERRMSRRYFFGLCAGAATLAAGLELVTVVEAKDGDLVVGAAPSVRLADPKDWGPIIVRSRSNCPVDMKSSMLLVSGEREYRLPARFLSSREWTSLTSGNVSPQDLERIRREQEEREPTP